MAHPNELGGMAPASPGLRSILEPGEQVLWSGRPVFSRYVRSGPWYLIPFSIMWCGFAIFWEASAIAIRAPLFFILWGVPFVLIGLYVVVGRYYVAARQARNAVYAVTDRRILIAGGAFQLRLSEMRLGSLPPVTVDQDLIGIGTVTFGTPMPYASMRMAGWPTGGMSGPPSFVCIEGASGVARIIEQARAAAVGEKPPPQPPAPISW